MTYKKGAVKLPTPKLNHTTDTGEPFIATECELLAQGKLERNGEVLRYHDLRVFVKVKE